MVAVFKENSQMTDDETRGNLGSRQDEEQSGRFEARIATSNLEQISE